MVVHSFNPITLEAETGDHNFYVRKGLRSQEKRLF